VLATASSVFPDQAECHGLSLILRAKVQRVKKWPAVAQCLDPFSASVDMLLDSSILEKIPEIHHSR